MYDLTRDELVLIRKSAFRDAADYLERTAADFQQTLNNMGQNLPRPERTALRDKVSLLMGQASQIRKME